MTNFYHVLPETTMQEAAQTLEKIHFVAVVRKTKRDNDQAPPVFVGEEALVFCAWSDKSEPGLLYTALERRKDS